MGDREELDALRRLAELEARSGTPQGATPPVEAPGLPQRAFDLAQSLMPTTLVARGLQKSMDLLDHAAYGAGGAVTDAAAKYLPVERTKPQHYLVPTAPEVGVGTNLLIQGVPTMLGGEGAKLASPTLQSGAKTLMQSALKPSSISQVGGVNSDAAKAIQTMLDEGIVLSPGGIAKARELVNTLHGQVAQLIQDAAKRGATVNKGYVDSEIYKSLQKFRNQLNSGGDEAAILKSWAETKAKLASDIPVLEAQKLKQGTYSILADKYAKGGTPAIENEASTQAQMAGARGLRLGLEDAVPGVGKLNAQEHAIINAIELSEKRSGIAGNRDIGGIAFLASNPKAAAAMMMDRSPAFKSWLATKIYKYQQGIPANLARGTIGVYENQVGGRPQNEIQQ